MRHLSDIYLYFNNLTIFSGYKKRWEKFCQDELQNLQRRNEAGEGHRADVYRHTGLYRRRCGHDIARGPGQTDRLFEVCEVRVECL